MFSRRAWHEQPTKRERALKGLYRALVGIGLPLLLLIVLVNLLTAKPGEQPPPPELAAADVEGDVPLDGVWRLEEGWVGYRILEDLPRLRGKHEVVGRTEAVDGVLEIDGTSVVRAELHADLGRLRSDSERRDRVLYNRYLETGEYPDASFTLPEPLSLMGLPAPGEPTNLTIPGEVTLHGETRTEDVSLEILWTGARLHVVGRVHVVLADYGIRPPRIFGFRLVDYEGDIELHLEFLPAD